MGLSYTTVAAVREYGAYEETDEDDLLHALIQSASQIIDRYCGRVFAVIEESTRTFTRVLRPELFDGKTLFLDEDMCTQASSITDSPTVYYLPENSTPYYAIVLQEGGWVSTSVEITAMWAYSQTPPPDIEQATLRLVEWLYDLRSTTTASVVVVTPEGQVLVPQGLPDDVVTILNGYRKVRMA